MTIRAILFDGHGEDDEVDLDDDRLSDLGDERLLWIDVEGREAAELERAAATIQLEDRALDRLRREDRRSRILRLTDRTVLTIGAVEDGDHGVERRELDIVVGRNHVLTVHDGPLGALDDFREQVSEDAALGFLDAWSLTSGIVDSILAAFFRHVEAIERDVDKLDQLAMTDEHGSGAFLEAVAGLRQRTARLRRALVPNREALVPLGRPDFDVHGEASDIWPGTLERLERAIDSIETARELVLGSFDLYLGRAAQRSNDVMKLLTIVSGVALPAVILAGVMGMNFQIPFFDEPSNFWVVVAIMVTASVTLLAVARWRRWV